MTDGIKMKGSVDPTAVPIHADEVNYDGVIGLVQRVKTGFGNPGEYEDVRVDRPLPVTDAAVAAAIATALAQLLAELGQKLEAGQAVALDTATLAALEQITVSNPTDVSALATQTTAAAILAKLSADPATQTTLAAVLAKLSSDPATQTTLASVLAALGGTLTTAPTTAGDVASTLTDGRKTVTTPTTAVALRASLACRWVCVTALKTNTSQVNVGGASVLATLGSETGQPLGAGDSVTIPVNDAAKVFVDARVAGEGVTFTVGA